MENLKSILKTGMIVVLRDGTEAIVLNNFNGTACNIFANKDIWDTDDNYKDDLKHKDFRGFDIVEVKKIKKDDKLCTIPLWIGGDYCNVEYEAIWKRREPKEMTVSEIEKALGYKIKVIADKEEKK